MKVAFRSILWALLLVPLPGCATLVSQGMYFSGDSSLDAPLGTIYLGTVGNIRGLSEASWGKRGMCEAWGPLVVIDLPLSLAMDTALLPICLIETVFFWDPPEDEQKQQEVPARPALEK